MPNAPRLWPGETFVCIGGGPSLTRADVDYVRGKARVIAINNAYQVAPWADVLWATDASWWRTHRKATAAFHGLKFSAKVSGAYERPDITLLRCSRKLHGMPGLSLDPGAIQHGKNGGHAAINLAVHLGAARIILLGYDCQLGPDGEEHWHPQHAAPKRLEFALWLKNFDTLVEPLRELGIEVVNCTRSTAIESFSRRSLEEVFLCAYEQAS